MAQEQSKNTEQSMPQDIYTVDESALFYYAQPNRTLIKRKYAMMKV
jgi:hypothetical protein